MENWKVKNKTRNWIKI